MATAVYERVDYTVLSAAAASNVLRVTPGRKKLGAPISCAWPCAWTATCARAAATRCAPVTRRPGSTAWVANCSFVGELGGSTGGSVEWYQPVDDRHRAFIASSIEYKRERNDYWFLEQRIAEYRTARTRARAGGGAELPAARAGAPGLARDAHQQAAWRPGWTCWVALATNRAERASGGWLFALDLEQADRLYFPSRGWAAKMSLYDSPRRDYGRLALEGSLAVPWERYVISARSTWVGATRGQLPLSDCRPPGRAVEPDGLRGRATGGRRDGLRATAG